MATPITVAPDTPIKDVLELMAKNQIGAVLIVDKSDMNSLLGIFTERDLLMHFKQLSAPGVIERPIRTVMTKNVKSIDVSRLKYAASMMVRNNFRHLPITEKTEKGQRLVAVISMRDLLKRVHTHIVEKSIGKFFGVNRSEDAKGSGAATVKGRVGVLSMDWAFRKMLAHAFAGAPGVSFNRVRLSELPEKAGHLDHLKRYSYLLIDVDSWKGKSWAELLGKIYQEPDGPIVMVFLTPNKYEAKVLEAVQLLTRSKRFSIFSKPVDYFDLIQNIELASKRSH